MQIYLLQRRGPPDPEYTGPRACIATAVSEAHARVTVAERFGNDDWALDSYVACRQLDHEKRTEPCNVIGLP